VEEHIGSSLPGHCLDFRLASSKVWGAVLEGRGVIQSQQLTLHGLSQFRPIVPAPQHQKTGGGVEHPCGPSIVDRIHAVRRHDHPRSRLNWRLRCTASSEDCPALVG